MAGVTLVRRFRLKRFFLRVTFKVYSEQGAILVNQMWRPPCKVYSYPGSLKLLYQVLSALLFFVVNIIILWRAR